MLWTKESGSTASPTLSLASVPAPTDHFFLAFAPSVEVLLHPSFCAVLPLSSPLLHSVNRGDGEAWNARRKPAATLQKPCRNPAETLRKPPLPCRNCAETLQKPAAETAETPRFLQKWGVSAILPTTPRGVRGESGLGVRGPT